MPMYRGIRSQSTYIGKRYARYTARGAVSLERLEEDADGDLIYTFTRAGSDGTTGITLAPLLMMRKMTSL
jgi:hypothetical protein